MPFIDALISSRACGHEHMEHYSLPSMDCIKHCILTFNVVFSSAYLGPASCLWPLLSITGLDSGSVRLDMMPAVNRAETAAVAATTPTRPNPFWARLGCALGDGDVL